MGELKLRHKHQWRTDAGGLLEERAICVELRRVTIKCIAYALAAALLVSSARADPIAIASWQCGAIVVEVTHEPDKKLSTYSLGGISSKDETLKFELDGDGKLYLNAKPCSALRPVAPEREKAKELPPYPPVVCVKPEWTPEPCESRQASSAHAEGTYYAPGTYPAGTYYAPGTYPGNFTAHDEEVLYELGLHYQLLPPLEYDHPYTAGGLLVIDGGDEMEKWCPNRHGFGYHSACARLDDSLCIIIHAPEKQIIESGRTLNIVMRHEIGHCNGWPEDHPGARAE